MKEKYDEIDLRVIDVSVMLPDMSRGSWYK